MDFNSETWKAIETWAKAEVQELRRQNDNELSEVDTANVRGQIRFAKKLIDLAERKNNPPVIHSGNYEIG